MRILLLAKKNPYPEKDGEAIAIMQMAKGLADAGCSVSVLYMNTPKHHCATSEIPVALSKQITFYTVDVNNSVSVSGALKSLVQTLPYHVTRFYSQAFEAKLVALLQQHTFDIIQAEGLYLLQYFKIIRKYSQAKLIYRSHNIEAEIWQNIAGNSNSIFKKWYLHLQADKLLRYEKNIAPLIDAIVPIATTDTLLYQQLFPIVPIHHAPTGVELNNAPQNSVAINFRSLYFIGGLDWLPNIEGLHWFINHVFSELQKHFPDLTFHIAGRNGDASWHQLNNQNIIFHGEVDDAYAFASDKFICIVPLLSGSGMKIKIVEAMQFGKPVVTTVKGANGMPMGIAEHIAIADNATQMSDCIKQLLSNPDNAMRQAQKAQQFVLNNLSHREIAKQLIQFYQTLHQ